MVGIMLHIQSDECLGYSINQRHCERSLRGDPQVLHVEEEGDVAHSSEVPSQRAKLTSAANNLKHFLFDLPLERRVELVPNQIESKSLSMLK